MPAFDSLHQQKRTEANIARRQSMSDQHVKGGIFSQLFHKYVPSHYDLWCLYIY